MVIYENKLTRFGHIKATFNAQMILTGATHYNGAATRPVRKGGLLWSKLQRRSTIYRYQNR
jgi:hypothetical protein